MSPVAVGGLPCRTRLKVCCIANSDEALAAIAAGGDALGLVSQMPSRPGVIEEAAIGRILEILPPPVEGFLLIQHLRADDLNDQARRVGARTLQLVREVPVDVHRRLQAAAPELRRVQVVHVEDSGAFDRALAYAPEVHALLLDSGRPNAEVAEFGGTGRRHDGAISRRIVDAVDVPVFLAGGLSPENSAEAIRRVRPFGVDLCSSVRQQGALQSGRLARLVRAIRFADAG